MDEGIARTGYAFFCLPTLAKGIFNERSFTMKAGIFFTGSGPILVLTSYDTLNEQHLLEKFKAKGIKKFIAYEVPVDLVKQMYGAHYDMVMQDLKQEDDLRVMDWNGHNVFYKFSIKELGEPTYFEE
jgi:hypothetical protein